MLSFLRHKVYSSIFNLDNSLSTSHGFHDILEKIPSESSILDVGCGDGIYYINPKVIDLIKTKKIKIKSIDIDSGAIKYCKERITKNKLEEYITVEAIDLRLIIDKYDYVLFMESFPVIELDLFEQLLKHASTITHNIFMYHNLVEEKNITMSFLKPKLKYASLVDFGRLTSLTEFKNLLITWGYEIENTKIEILLQNKLKNVYFIFKYIPEYFNTDLKQYLVSINV